MSARHHTDVYLHPGEWFVGGADTRIRTLLGSCVSIALWHPKQRIGGMCHYMLDRRRDNAGGALSGRYADEAMLLMLQELLPSGLALREFHAKLIGGAETLGAPPGAPASHDVAGRNIGAAHALVRQFGFKLLAEDLGGYSARTVLFDVDTGDVWVRRTQDAPEEPGFGADKRKGSICPSN